MTLTIEEIEELRVRVANKLGWRKLAYNRDGSLIGNPPGRSDVKAVPSYVTNVRDAWDIIELLTSMGVDIQITNVLWKGCVGTYKVSLKKDEKIISEACYPKFPCAAAMAFLAMPQNERLKMSGDYRAEDYDALERHR